MSIILSRTINQFSWTETISDKRFSDLTVKYKYQAFDMSSCLSSSWHLRQANCCFVQSGDLSAICNQPAQLLSDHPGHVQGNEQRVIIFTRPRAAGQGGNNKHQAVEIEFISPCSELVNCNHHLPVCSPQFECQCPPPLSGPALRWECLIWLKDDMLKSYVVMVGGQGPGTGAWQK